MRLHKRLRVHCKQALAAFKDSTFLLESLIWKIADLRRMDGIKQAHFKALVADLARSHA